MGNQQLIICEAHRPDLEEQITNFRDRNYDTSKFTLEKLREIQKYYIESRNIKQQDFEAISKLISINQVNVAQALRKAKGKQKYQFCQKIQEVDFEQLDSLYHQEMKKMKSEQNKYRQYRGLKQVVNKYKDLTNQQIKDYEQTGKQAIKNSKIALLIFVECFGTENSFQNQLLCLKPTNLPSKKCSLRYYLQRINYLNTQLLTNILVVIIVDHKLQNKIIEWIKANNQLNVEIQVKPYKPTIPNVNQKGMILFERQYQFSYCDQKGDILWMLHRSNILKNLEKRGIEYVHMVDPHNLLEKVCDPFLLGYLINKDKKVVTKVMGGCASKMIVDQRFDYVVSTAQNKVVVKNQQQLLQFPQLQKLIFVHSTIMRTSYLSTELFTNLKQQASSIVNCKKIKINYYDPINEGFSFQKQPNGLVFCREQKDIIVGKQIELIKVYYELEYADLRRFRKPEVVVSNYHKMALGIKNNNEEQLVEISPLIAYDGKEGIEEIKEELFTNQEIGYPLQIRE